MANKEVYTHQYNTIGTYALCAGNYWKYSGQGQQLDELESGVC